MCGSKNLCPRRARRWYSLVPVSRTGERSSPPQAARRPFVRAPMGHNKPQIKGRAVLRRGRRGWYLAYEFPTAFRMFEMSIMLPIPREFTDGREVDLALDGTKVDVFIRQYVNAAHGDEPGTVVDDSPGDRDDSK